MSITILQLYSRVSNPLKFTNNSNTLCPNNCYLFFLSHCIPPNEVSYQNLVLQIKILFCSNEINGIFLEKCVSTFLKNIMHKIQISLWNHCIFLDKYH